MKNLLLSAEPVNMKSGMLILRLMFGLLFIYHGGAKAMVYSEYADYFPAIVGLDGKTAYILITAVELLGGILVTLGLFTRLAVIPVFIGMMVAYFVAHSGDEFNEKELSLVFMILSVVIFLLGSGSFSLDRLIFKK